MPSMSRLLTTELTGRPPHSVESCGSGNVLGTPAGSIILEFLLVLTARSSCRLIIHYTARKLGASWPRLWERYRRSIHPDPAAVSLGAAPCNYTKPMGALPSGTMCLGSEASGREGTGRRMGCGEI